MNAPKRLLTDLADVGQAAHPEFRAISKPSVEAFIETILRRFQSQCNEEEKE